MPRYIALCIESIRQCCTNCQFNLVTPQNIAAYLPEGMLHQHFSVLQPAHKADCIRAALLAQHGGLYMDADTVCLRSPAGNASDHDLVYCVWDNAPRRVLNGYIYAKPGSCLAWEWVDAINDALASGRLNWTSLGEGVLTSLVAEHPETTREMPRSTFLPLDVDGSVATFFTNRDFEDFVKPESVAFGLNNSWMMARRRNDMLMSAEAMAQSPLMIHRLLTWAAQRYV